MSQRVDAIVIGAGMGGLAAAAGIAGQGHRVLLLERHTIPGGYATSFMRGRFEFKVALHQLSNIRMDGGSGPLLRILEDLGAADGLEFVPMPLWYRSVFPGLDLRVPTGPDAFVETIGDQFPAERDGLRRFVDLLLVLDRELAQVQKSAMPDHGGNPALRDLACIPLRAPNLCRYALATLDQVLRRYVSDPLARAVISQTWGYYGKPPSQISFLFFAAGSSVFIQRGVYYLRGRSQALSNALVASIEARGGEVRLGCGVARIISRDGVVTGVITEQGQVVEAEVVVCNASPLVTCRDLLGPDEVPRRFWNRLRSTTVGPSSLNVFLGLGRPAADLGLVDNDIFLNADADLDGHYAATHGLEDPLAVMVTCHSAHMPELSPPGTSVLALTSLSYGQAWMNLRPEEVLPTKTRLAEGMLARVEGIFPGVREAIEEVEVGTPLTNMRYTGHPGGAIYGFDQPPSETFIWRLPYKGPLGGLFFAGAWSIPGGGFEPTLASGWNAAKQVCAALRTSRRARQGAAGGGR